MILAHVGEGERCDARRRGLAQNRILGWIEHFQKSAPREVDRTLQLTGQGLTRALLDRLEGRLRQRRMQQVIGKQFRAAVEVLR